MGYFQRAAGLAEQIRGQLGAAVTLVEGGKGVFEVHADGVPVYSKAQTKRMPNPAVILESLRGLRHETGGNSG